MLWAESQSLKKLLTLLSSLALGLTGLDDKGLVGDLWLNRFLLLQTRQSNILFSIIYHMNMCDAAWPSSMWTQEIVVDVTIMRSLINLWLGIELS